LWRQDSDLADLKRGKIGILRHGASSEVSLDKEVDHGESERTESAEEAGDSWRAPCGHSRQAGATGADGKAPVGKPAPGQPVPGKPQTPPPAAGKPGVPVSKRGRASRRRQARRSDFEAGGRSSAGAKPGVPPAGATPGTPRQLPRSLARRRRNPAPAVLLACRLACPPRAVSAPARQASR